MMDVAAALLDRVLAFLGARGVSVSIVLALTAFLLYSRKAMLVGAIVADWTSKLMVSVAVLLVLLISGVVTGVDVGRAFNLVATLFDWLSTLFEGVVA